MRTVILSEATTTGCSLSPNGAAKNLAQVLPLHTLVMLRATLLLVMSFMASVMYVILREILRSAARRY